MSFMFDERDALSSLDQSWSPGPRTGLVENFEAAWAKTARVDRTTSRRDNLAEAYEPLIQALNENTPARERVLNPYGRPAAYRSDLRGVNPADLEAQVWDRIQQRRQAEPDFLKDHGPDRDALHARVRGQSIQALRDADEIAGRATTSGDIGEIAGGMASSILDPPNIITALWGGNPAAGVLRFALIEGAIGAATEAVIQVPVARNYQALGFDYTIEDAARNVALAGAGGALFGGAIGAGIKYGPALVAKTAARLDPEGAKRRILGGELKALVTEADPADVAQAVARLTRRELLDALDRNAITLDRDGQAARLMLENGIEIDAASPFPPTGAGQAEHARRLIEAMRAAEDGRQPDIPETPSVPVVARGENSGGIFTTFRPADLATDATAMQYKSGADSAGVTDRLIGVTQWDPIKAGVVVVWQRADGARIIADGHQRLGLAQRLAETDPTITLKGYLFREADGYSAAEVRAIAAAKNMAEGTGSAIDAAKVLKARPDLMATLPPRSELVRQGSALANLSDRAFGLVVNEVVPAHYAAIVGRLVWDAKTQLAALEVLAKAEPENLTQAESIVRQVMTAGLWNEIQLGLFGKEEVAVSLFKDRARLLDKAIKQLRRDRTVFDVLTREGERIEAAGNRLARETNQERATVDAQAIQIIQALATRTGPVSDALTNAARRAVAEGRDGGALDEFVGIVRGEIERGDLAGLLTGGTGRGGEAPGPVSELDGIPGAGGEGRGADPDAPARYVTPAQESESLGLFDQPAGKGQIDQADQIEREIRGDPGPRAAETEAPALAPAGNPLDDFIAGQRGIDLDQLHARATALQDGLAKAGKRIETELGVKFKNPGVKDKATAAEKIVRKGYTDLARLTDLARGGFRVNTPAEAEAIARALARDFDVLDEGWKATDLGYFDRKMLVRGADGTVGEIQIWSLTIIETKGKGGGHKLYEQWRRLPPGSPAAVAVEKESIKLYRQAAAAGGEEWLRLYAALMDLVSSTGSGGNSPKVLRKASSDIRPPVEPTSLSSTSTQGPPGSSTANEGPPGARTAGRQSQFRNESFIGEPPPQNIGSPEARRNATREGIDLDQEIPVGVVSRDGQLMVETRPARELLDEIDADRQFADELGLCLKIKGGAA